MIVRSGRAVALVALILGLSGFTGCEEEEEIVAYGCSEPDLDPLREEIEQLFAEAEVEPTGGPVLADVEEICLPVLGESYFEIECRRPTPRSRVCERVRDAQPPAEGEEELHALCLVVLEEAAYMPCPGETP